MEFIEFEQNGYAAVPGILSDPEIATLIAAFGRYAEIAAAPSAREGSIYGLRNLLREVPEVRDIVRLPSVQRAVRTVLGAKPFAVRAIYFDKTPGANWHVTWHQDRAIAVRERIETPGFGPWSVKNGIPHVHPPAEVLERMVALRLHLDACGADNGPLKVLAGTHRDGKWNDAQIDKLRGTIPETVCVAERGDGLLMRPLLLHASGIVTGSAVHRRVLHIEWAAGDLPDRLCWFDRVTAE